jgi:hypothetical protein
MKLPWLILIMLLACCAIFTIVFCLGAPLGGDGFTHPEYSTMRRGGDGVERLEGVHALGWLFGILHFCICVALLVMGANKQGRLGILKRPILIGLVLNVLLLCAMMAVYFKYAREGTGALFGSLPWPTALMMYGVWPIQLIFVFIYIWGFDRWIFTDQDEKKFRQLVGTHKGKAGDNA